MLGLQKSCLYGEKLGSCSWRKAVVGFEAASVGFEDNGVDEKQVAVVIDKHITIHGIKNVVCSVSVVFAVVLRMET